MEKVDNSHITSYLEYYTQLKTSPGFAVLIKGEWGAGKSWFVKKFLEDKKEKKKNEKPKFSFLHVSLYGINNFKAIEDSFYQQLHPILSSKGMKLTGKVLKGLLKTAVKVDLNRDGDEETTISSTIPDADFQEFLDNVDSSILVFDDLERCSIELPSILGYINQYVENHGAKVIIIANEIEIHKKEAEEDKSTKSNSYQKIKEKLVGKTFEVKADFKNAFISFCNDLTNKEVAKFLKEKEVLIHTIFNQAKYNNLRHLKHSILDFERFYSFLPEFSFKKKDLIEEILSLFFAISFEIRKGTIKESDINSLFSIDIMIASGISKEETEVTKIRKKYPVFMNYSPPVNERTWTEFFNDGTIDTNFLNNSIKNSNYFLDERTPLWVKFWRFFDMEDDQFKKTYIEIYKSFSEFKIENKYELVHVTGTLIRCSEIKLIPNTKKQLLKIAKKNVDLLKKAGLLKNAKNEEFPSESFGGLGYHGMHIPEFKEFLSYVRTKVKDDINDSYPGHAEALTKEMKDSPALFSEKLLLSNSRNNLFFDIPILKYIKPEIFVDAIFDLKVDAKKEVGRVFQERYKHAMFNPKLIDELEWLKAVRGDLNKKKLKVKGKISEVIIREFIIKGIDEAIANLSPYKKVPSPK